MPKIVFLLIQLLWPIQKFSVWPLLMHTKMFSSFFSLSTMTYIRIALGLSGEQMDRICKTTNIVFHCAATLKLEANLKDALDMNTSGTKRVLDLAKKMPNLQALIHLSTAFCYCDQEVLLEKVYECQHDPNELMRLAEWMDVKTLDKITPELLHPHPNTYTYSKRLAEILVQNEYPNMPVAITRPSIGEYWVL